MDMLDSDMEAADCVLWVGLSFEQSATTSYFRRVRSALSAAGRFAAVPQFLVNPSDEALWNLLSSCSNQGEVEVAAIIASSDDVLPKVRLYGLLAIDDSKASSLLYPFLLWHRWDGLQRQPL